MKCYIKGKQQYISQKQCSDDKTTMFHDHSAAARYDIDLALRYFVHFHAKQRLDDPLRTVTIS